MRSIKFIFDSTPINDQLKAFKPINTAWAKIDESQRRLRIEGGASLTSASDLNLIGLPITDTHITVHTKMEYSPAITLQSAGLVCFFDNGYWHYLNITSREKLMHLQITTCHNFEVKEHFSRPIERSESSVELKLSIESDKVLFYYSTTKHQWHKISQTLNLNRSKINENSILGICCLDHFGRESYADFEFIKYQIFEEQA